jgi:hypothetical protein
MLLLMPAITSTKTLSANQWWMAQAPFRAYPTGYMLFLCVLGSQPQNCTCKVMRRTDALCSNARQTVLYASLVLAQARGQPPATRLIPQRHGPHSPYFDWLQMLQVYLYEWRRIFDPHILRGCMDLIMPESFGGGALEEETNQRHQSIDFTKPSGIQYAPP